MTSLKEIAKGISTELATSVFIDVFADLYTQKSFEKKRLNQLDWKRVFKMGSFAGIRTIFLQNYFSWLDSTFKGDGWKTAVKKIAFDQAVASPIVISFFLFYMSLFEGNLKDFPKKMKSLPSFVINGIKVWGTVAVLNFTIIPPYMRIYLGSVVGFFWSIYLSLNNEKTREKVKEN